MHGGADARHAASRPWWSTTAREYAGWQSQAHAASLQDAVETRDWHSSPARPSPRSAPGAPMPAFTRSAKSSTSTPRRAHARAPGCSDRTPAAARDRAAVGGRGRPGISCAAHRSAPRLSVLHFELERAPGAAQACAAPGFPVRSTPRRCIAAAQALLGEHDFSAFRSVECQSKTQRAARRAHRGAARRRLRVDGDHGERLPAPHGAQHRRNAARGAARGGPVSAPWRAFLRAASGAWRAPPRRPPGLYLWRVEYPPIHGIPAPRGRGFVRLAA